MKAETGPWCDADPMSMVRREQAALDRHNALRDRAEAATERHRAGQYRGTALADRVAGASGRDYSELDRGTAMGDRAASATDRQYAAELATNLAFGWTVGQLDPPELLYASPGYLQILGLPDSRSDLTLAEALAMVVPDDAQPMASEYSKPVTPGVTIESEMRIVRPDGEIRWIRSMSRPVVDDHGVITRAATTVEDVTARKDAEAALLLAQQTAERANAAKSEFLSRMSHELRTPLNAVLGFAQLLELESLPSPQLSAVGHILRGGRRLLEMIEDALDMSDIDTGRLSVTVEPIVISELLPDVLAVMRPIAAASKVAISTLEIRDLDTSSAGVGDLETGSEEMAGSGPVRAVLADRRRLRQVLMQLLSNAIKYNAPHGRVEISCAVLPGQQALRLSVADTGCGIAPADVAGLFIPFERATLKRSDIEGTGIGLALSFRLMAIMGGRLEVRSELGIGRTFSVTLPLAG